MKRALVIDTSILCVWLKVPGKETCGNEKDTWNFQRVKALLDKEIAQNTLLVLPLATIIETGNHIAQARSKRYEAAQALAEIMIKAADQETPWAAFTEQAELWEASSLKELAKEWPDLAKQKISIGDAAIKNVADYYSQTNYQVEIFTGDAGLKAYEPLPPSPMPRRRKIKN